MARSNELDGGGGSPDGSGVSREDTSFDLGSPSEWVSGSTADWQALGSYLITILVLIVAETWARAVSGLFELPRRGLAAVGEFYALLVETVLGIWPSVFEVSFDSAAGSIPDMGVFGFAAAVLFVVVWFLVLNELLEVL